jgi:hypothetical protein
VKALTIFVLFLMLCTAVSAQQSSQATVVNRIEELRAHTEKSLGEYDRVVGVRDDLTLQLQEAVGIDDKVLIHRAVNDLEENRTTLLNVAGQLESNRSKLMEEAGQELLAKQISKTMYVYQLDFARQVDQLIKQPPSGLLLGLLIDAHNKAETSFVYSDFIQEKKTPAREESASAKAVP